MAQARCRRWIGADIRTRATRPPAKYRAEESQAAGARATIIDLQGKVLADSEAEPASMENHAQRAGVRGCTQRRHRH